MTQPHSPLVFAIVLASSGCSSSSPAVDSAANESLTCQNGTSPGPESEACDACGRMNCASQHVAVTSSCATMVSCIEACQCDANDTCITGCFDAASASCQGDLNAYADCEKMAPACAPACTQ